MPERARGLRLRLGTVAAAAVAWLVIGCGGDPGASGASGAPESPVAARPTSPPSAIAGLPTSGAPLVVDPGLLRVLPATVGGVALQQAPDSAASMIGDPELAKTAYALAVGVAVAAGNSKGDDLAISTVVQLRQGVFNDAFYAAWRSSYDQAACEPAGGVASNVTQVIGRHTVEVAVCHAGAKTYHTTLSGERLLSITAVGDRKFGDLVIGGLRE